MVNPVVHTFNHLSGFKRWLKYICDNSGPKFIFKFCKKAMHNVGIHIFMDNSRVVGFGHHTTDT